MNNFEKVVALITHHMGTYKFELTRETKLERDLGISGDDAWDLIVDYSKKFNVDITCFEMNKYFSPEGDSILPSIFRTIQGEKNPHTKELTIGNLESALELGRLSEDSLK
jgi:acyl carrier protein